MEWRPQEVFKLINIYKQYECLWNFKSASYKRTDLKKNAWAQLAKEFKKYVGEIKKKIKHLRDSYVVEKKKFDNNKKSGSSSEHIYEPHLFYFDEMSFLNSVGLLRKTSSNLETETIEVEDDLDTTLVEDDPLPSTSRPINIPRNSSSSISSGSATTPEPIVRRRRCSRKSQNDTKYDDAINAIVASVSGNECDDVYTSFGKTIASQLRQLSLVDATETMSEIHTLVSQKILAKIRNQNKVTWILQSAIYDADITFDEMFSCSQ